MSVKTRITAFAAVSAILLAVIMTAGVFAAESKQMTTAMFEAKLESFKEDVYADGSTYEDDVDTYLGIQCYGFANQIAKYFYGSWPTYDSRGLKANADWVVSYGSEALMNVHVGDIVRYRSSTRADHSVFVTGMDEDYIYFSDANNDHENTVRHNAKLAWTKLIEKMDKKLEKDSSCIGWVAHYKYWDDDPEHVGIGTELCFSSNGGTIDGEYVADKYIVLDTLNMREGPGLDYDRVTKMYDDSYFDVPRGAETVEADGYVWAPVTQGKYSGWAVINDGDWCKPVGNVRSGEYYVGEKDGLVYKSYDLKKVTLSVEEDVKLPKAEEFGLYYEGAEFSGWSLKPGESPVDISNLLEEFHGVRLTLYAVWERDGEYLVPVTTQAKETEEETTAETAEETTAETDEETTAETEEITETTAPETEEPEPVKLRGDVNGDGMLDNKDVVALFSILSKKLECDTDVCDANGDGCVDNKDITHLFRKLSSISAETTEAEEVATETDTAETEETTDTEEETQTETEE